MRLVWQCYRPATFAVVRRVVSQPLRRPTSLAAAFRFYSGVPPKQENKPTKDETSEPKSDEKPSFKTQPLDDIKNLPSQDEANRSEFSKWMVERLDTLQTYIFTAGQTLNDFTGYSSIEKLKNQIEGQESQIAAHRESVQKCKTEYASAIAQRSDSQREVNELLQRKNSWAPHDLERFTELYRNDHANQNAEKQAEDNLSAAERELEESLSQMTRLISARYHEEQIWSDKIRRASTWGTWLLMGFNMFLFLVVQLGLEPWKRRRLVGSFEDKVKEALEEDKESRLLLAQQDSTTDDKARLDRLEQLAAAESQALQVLSGALLAQPAPAPQEPPSTTPAAASLASTLGLTWRTFPERLLSSMDTPASSAQVRPQEVAGLVGFGAVVGALLGSLVVSLVKG